MYFLWYFHFLFIIFLYLFISAGLGICLSFNAVSLLIVIRSSLFLLYTYFAFWPRRIFFHFEVISCFSSFFLSKKLFFHLFLFSDANILSPLVLAQFFICYLFWFSFLLFSSTQLLFIDSSEIFKTFSSLQYQLICSIFF